MPPTSLVAADARAPAGCTGGWMVSPERTETAVAGVRKAVVPVKAGWVVGAGDRSGFMP